MRETLGLLGRKVGMTRIFTDEGESVPVTVLDVSNNRVAQVRTTETDGYSGIQVAYGARRSSRVSKPQAGHFAKAGIEAGSTQKEFRLGAKQAERIQGRRDRRHRYFLGWPKGRCHRRDDWQGLRRSDQAPSLLVESCDSRQLSVDQRAGFNRHASGSGPRDARQADGGPFRRQTAHDTEPGRCANRHRAATVADSWCSAGGCRR